MQNIKQTFSNIKGKFGNKKVLYPIIITLIVIFGFTGFKSVNYITKRFEVPQVSGANFSIEYRKIPFDSKTLEVSFNTNLKQESINNKTINLSPFIEGKTTLKDKNTIVYTLNQNLEIGQEYSLSINENVESEYGMKIGKPYNVIFEAISGAKVTKILPENTLDNISQNLLVLFNIPLIPLTSLDNKDKLPCPVEISPKIEGKCKWTGGNVVEFIPTKYWEGATEYKVTVTSSSGLLYPLKEKKEVTFKTPVLNFISEEKFSPRDGLLFKANFPINSSDVENKLVLKDGETLIPSKLVSIDGSETRYSVKPIVGNFNYGKSYSLSAPAGLKPKYGNIPTSIPYSFSTKTVDYTQQIDIYQTIYSSTGAIEDTPNFSDRGQLPTKNTFFKIFFDEEVELNNSLFSFSKKDGGTAIPFDLKYGTETSYENGKSKETQSKKIIVLSLKKDLDYSNIYYLKVLKKANPNLVGNETYEFKTVPKFRITSFEYKNNTLACVYVSNDLYNQVSYGMDWNGNDSNQKAIKTTPVSIVRGITKDIKNYSTQEYSCPQKAGEISYLLNLRLNPFSDYTINIPSSLKDGYGNTLDKEYSYKVKSADVKDTDKYIYSSFSKPINVIPSTEPSVINIQSINLDKVSVDVYELDTIGYYDYISNHYKEGYTPKSIKNYTKEINLKNKYWEISNNRFDIEKDIVGEKLSSPIYLIKSSIADPNRSNDGKEFSNIIIKTNLSLILEAATNKQLIFASSFDGKDTPKDLEFEGYSMNGSSVKYDGKIKAKWIDDKKVYELPSNSSVIIIGENSKYYGIINTNSDQTSNYDFKYISGQDSSTKDYLYLYTERPLYRPGDTVFFKGILRNFDFSGYKKSLVSKGVLKILDINGQFFRDINVTVDKNSNFSGKFELPKDMNLGRYNFEFYPDGNPASVYNDGQFFVEEYKKPVFKINMSSDKKDVVIGDKVKINFDSEYYFGGRLTGAHYFKSVLSQNYYFDAKDYGEYQFSNGYDAYNCLYWGYCSYSDNTEFSQEGDMNASGQEEWNYDFPKDILDENKNNLGEKIYSFNVTIEDPDTKKQVNKAHDVVLHNTDAYIGIRVPYYSVQKDGVKLSGVILNHQAQPLSNKNAKIELIGREWKNVKKQGVDGIFYNEYAVEEKSEGTFDMTSDSKGEFSDTLMPKKSGEYEVRASYIGENGKAFISSTYIYIGGEETYYWGNGNNTTTDMVADKNLLKIGDKAAFTLKSPVSSGKIFITVEKDDGILDYFTQDIHSTGERIEVPIKDSYYPNIYVKAFLIGQNGTNPLPIYKRSLNVIKVVTDYKKIKVSVKPAKNHYLPGEKVTLKIKTTDGEGKVVPYANGSVSVVDESLLALKGNPKKNPYAFFYDMKRYLGVETYLSLFNLVEKLEVKDISDGEKGGAGEGAKGGDSKKKRGVFKDTAFWQADYSTDKNGEATLTTEALPDNLTTWVIESVASTPTDNKIGVGEATITTTKKVIINENVPRFLGSNDTIILSPVVFNKTGKNSTFKVSLDATNLEVENPNQEISINNGAQKTVEFKVKVKDIGVAKSKDQLSSKLTFKAISSETKDQDEIEKFLTIEETSTLETVSTVGKTDSVNFTEKVDLTDVILSSAKLAINYAPTILSNITSGIDFLANFPYGCIEQKQSAILPNVYIKKLYTSVDLPFDLTKKMVKVWVDSDTGYKEVSEDEIIKNFISESVRYQKTSGGFGYWSDDVSYNPANFHLTSLVITGLSEIKSIGYTLNETSQKSAVSYLKTRFYANQVEGCYNPNEYNNFCKYEEADRLEAINSILSKDKDEYEAYKMWKLIDLKNEDLSVKINKLSVISKLLNNKNVSDKDKKSLKEQAITLANKVIGEYIVYNPRGAFLGKDSFNSRILNTSDFVGALSDLGLDNFKDVDQLIDNMNRWIISQKKDGSFGSTEETIHVIKNMTKYIIASGELKDLKSNIKVNLNGELVDEKNIDTKNKLETYLKAITGDKVNAESRENTLEYKLKVQNDVTFNKAGNGKVYYDLALSYYLPIEKVQPRDEGFYLEQTYFDYNEFRKIETLKNKQWESYLTGNIDYKDLKYPKNVVEYLTPITEFKVGQIVLAYNKVVTSEPRDQVAFEGHIPSGSELINTNLSTENKSLKFTNNFTREEFRDERYFGYTDHLEAGLFEFNYVVRITHAGSFNLKPSQISEFYKSEVFGRNGGRKIEVK